MMFFYFFQFFGLAARVSRGALMSVLPFQHSYCLARGFLFFLAGVGFLLVLAACGGGGSSGGGMDSSPSTEPSVRGLDCSADAGQDCDGDGHKDNEDIDDDGDGLIEIRTARQLNAVRFALSGDGRRSSPGGSLDTTGCGGGQDAEGVNITTCSGYELVADISLTAYVNADEGKGWQPLGHDNNSSLNGCQGPVFRGTFEGNDWTISDLNISRSGEDCVGLFGRIEGGKVRNLEVEAAHITGKNRVGILAGVGNDPTSIRATSVSSSTLRGEERIGGLIGHLSRGTIISTSAEVNGEIVGNDRIGGLIGHAWASRIRHSSAINNDIRGRDRLGGLLGSSWDVEISGSVAVFNELHGRNLLGGLVGDSAAGRTIIASMARFSLINGSGNSAGGLIGGGAGTRITSSMASGGGLVGSSRVGGLIGEANKNIVFTSSYAVVSDINGSSDTNGLVGLNTSMVTINDSYWAVFPADNLPSDAFAKSISDLQSPTEFSGSIYDSWDDGTDLNRWCDSNNNGRIETGERTDGNLIWDLGIASEYPVVRCTPISPADWRDW